jgi:hypothetical protein
VHARGRVVLDGVDGDDVGMIERGDGAGLAAEPIDARRIVREAGRQGLQRDVTSEPGVERAIDLSMPPAPSVSRTS